MKIEDLNEIEANIKETLVENNFIANKCFSLIDNKLSKQTKIYINNYIYDILKDNENFKQEGLFV